MNNILKSFIPTMHLIKRTIGECEVVLHDMSTPQNSVVFVLGNVTNRKVGESFNHLIKDVLLNKNFENDCTANYYFKDSKDKLIRSSTSLIRDENDKVIGALCINIDTKKSLIAHELIQSMLPNFNFSDKKENNSNKKNQDINMIVEDIIKQTTFEFKDKKLNKDEKNDVIKFLYDKGVFEVKGAVSLVAKHLNTANATIYSYLNEIKKYK